MEVSCEWLEGHSPRFGYLTSSIRDHLSEGDNRLEEARNAFASGGPRTLELYRDLLAKDGGKFLEDFAVTTRNLIIECDGKGLHSVSDQINEHFGAG